MNRSSWGQFHKLLLNAQAQQEQWLLGRVRAGEQTRFGRDHHFNEIRSLADFRKQVPISGYDYFDPYIDEVAGGNPSALVPSHEKLLRFTITTGTTGKPKLNPVTSTWLKEYKQAWGIWGMKLFADHPTYLGTKMLQMAGTWDMGTTTGGFSISMVSALLARIQNPMLRPFYAVPSALNDIPDPITRYYTVLRLCLDEPIGWILLMNPGTLIRLAQVGDIYKEQLIRDLRDGTLSSDFEISDSVRQSIAKRIDRKRPQIATRLQQIVERTGQLLPKDYWNQPVISCWLGGTAGYQSRSIPEYFGDSPQRDMGLVSSEGRQTIPIEDGIPAGVPSLVTGFYEYVPVHEMDSENPQAVDGPDLVEGEDYYLVMTTSAGYYRYHIGDIVRCVGFVGQAPLLEFRQKGGRVGDLEGEKVTERQIVEAVETAAAELQIPIGLFTAVPIRPEKSHPYYEFLFEENSLPDTLQAQQLLAIVDRELAKTNFLWRARRKEKVLESPILIRLPAGTWDAYTSQIVAEKGTGDYQYKHPALVTQPGWRDQFPTGNRLSLLKETVF